MFRHYIHARNRATWTRRAFAQAVLGAVGTNAGFGALAGFCLDAARGSILHTEETSRGAQRLAIEKLQGWEKLGYGMFLHHGISTFTGQEWSDGKAPASAYNPDKLDVDQWIQVARDAGMKYAVLTTKHVAGHCLWPSRETDYTVAHSGNTTDVVGAFVKACERRGVQPGFYYCSFDNHHLFGSVTVDHTGLPFDTVEQVHIIERSGKAFTTSAYQDFETAQITELLTQYGPVVEMWIDEPGILGHGYRTFLYEHIASLQPNCVIMANGSYGDSEKWDPWFTWPQDVIGYEQYEPSPPDHLKWRTVEGKRYYLPAEVYDVIGGSWFYKDSDKVKTDSELSNMYTVTRERGANLLLDVPPDQHGLIPQRYRDALMRLRRNAGL
jgi:alpha-L-fucosidase